MTTYTAITSGEIDADSPITTGLMTLLRDNPIAITEGASGAPQIQTAAIATDAVTTDKILDDNVTQDKLATDSVGQDQLKTSYQEVSQGGSPATVSYTATGGAYQLGASFDVGANVVQLDKGCDYNTTNFEFVILFTSGTTGDDFRSYYVNASPPYDLGDGDIPLFIYAAVDKTTGEIVATSAAVDPPWLYNGPTNCRPAARDPESRRTYRTRRDMSGVDMTLAEAVAAGAGAVREYAQAYQAAELVLEEITPALKNADMEIIPSSFARPIPGCEIVLLDPVGDTVRELSALHNHDGAELGRVIRQYIRVDNDRLKRAAPRSIRVVSAKWRGA